MQVAEQEAESIAQLAIELGAALHQVFAGGHVFAEVNRRDPEAHDLAAHAFGDVDGIDAVAEGFRHGAALLVEGPAGCGDVGIRRAASQRDRGEQRRVEPTAVLVAALEIEALRGCRLSPFGRAHKLGVRSGSDSQTANQLVPESNQTSRMSVSLRKSWPDGRTVRARLRPCPSATCIDRRGVPGFGAFALEEIDDLAVERGIEDRLTASLAQEDGDGHAPDALAADAPVGARRDHVCDALFAPGRIPDHLVDLFDR